MDEMPLIWMVELAYPTITDKRLHNVIQLGTGDHASFDDVFIPPDDPDGILQSLPIPVEADRQVGAGHHRHRHRQFPADPCRAGRSGER